MLEEEQRREEKKRERYGSGELFSCMNDHAAERGTCKVMIRICDAPMVVSIEQSQNVMAYFSRLVCTMCAMVRYENCWCLDTH